MPITTKKAVVIDNPDNNNDTNVDNKDDSESLWQIADNNLLIFHL